LAAARAAVSGARRAVPGRTGAPVSHCPRDRPARVGDSVARLDDRVAARGALRDRPGRASRPPARARGRMARRAGGARRTDPHLDRQMIMERSVRIVNKNGLHARPAAELVKTASKFQSEITMVRDDLEVNGKSIMGVMMLAAECGAELVVRADGPDAEQAVQAIADLVARKFGEQ